MEFKMITKAYSEYSDKTSFIAINPDIKEIIRLFRNTELIRFIVTNDEDDIILGNADYFYHCELIKYAGIDSYKCYWLSKQRNEIYLLDCDDHLKRGYKYAFGWFSTKNQLILKTLASVMKV